MPDEATVPIEAAVLPATPGALPDADSTVTASTADGRDVTTREWRVDDRLAVRYVAIAGLGHAWSGGDAALAFNDARAPDASQLVGEFLREAFPWPSVEERNGDAAGFESRPLGS